MGQLLREASVSAGLPAKRPERSLTTPLLARGLRDEHVGPACAQKQLGLPTRGLLPSVMTLSLFKILFI